MVRGLNHISGFQDFWLLLSFDTVGTGPQEANFQASSNSTPSSPVGNMCSHYLHSLGSNPGHDGLYGFESLLDFHDKWLKGQLSMSSIEVFAIVYGS